MYAVKSNWIERLFMDCFNFFEIFEGFLEFLLFVEFFRGFSKLLRFLDFFENFWPFWNFLIFLRFLRYFGISGRGLSVICLKLASIVLWGNLKQGQELHTRAPEVHNSASASALLIHDCGLEDGARERVSIARQAADRKYLFLNLTP